MATDRFASLPPSRALSIFFTAGFPKRDDTMTILKELQAAEVDMVELGFPFSDPVADGPTIQESSLVALNQGMSVSLLFEQLASLRTSGITYPVLLMGYLNPLEQFGRSRFFERAEACGVDGLIIPDLPFEEYLSDYKALFVKHRLRPVFLVTPRTPAERIRAFDDEAPAFLYVLSSDAVTGGRASVSDERQAFFKKLRDMGLKSRLIVGFGVADRESFTTVTTHTDGAIVGSAFVRALGSAQCEPSRTATPQGDLNQVISNFIKGMR